MMEALIVAPLRTFPVSAPKVASAMPPPMAAPMPPSDFAFCIKTNRIRMIEVRMRTIVRNVRRMPIWRKVQLTTRPRALSTPGLRRQSGAIRLLHSQFFEEALQVLIAAVLDHDSPLLRRMDDGDP